jgi:hypothetical protein
MFAAKFATKLAAAGSATWVLRASSTGRLSTKSWKTPHDIRFGCNGLPD